MTLVTSDFLAGLMTNYRAIFKTALDEAFAERPLYQDISTKFDSVTDKESYGWLGANPTMSEWLDKRQLKSPNAYDYTLTNKHYEGTISINRDTYDDDKYGMIAPRIKGLANRAIRHFNQMVLTQLDDGASLLAYDDAAFFGTARTIGSSGTIANQLTGNYSDSEAEIRAGIAAAFVAMQGFKDDQGIVMGLMPDTIVCSPTMLIPIRQALVPAVAGTSRPEAGIISPDSVKPSPWIDATATTWYMLCTKQIEVKPLIFQLRKNVEFVAMDKPDDANVFMQNEFYYGVDDRFATGYGDPRTAIQIVNS